MVCHCFIQALAIKIALDFTMVTPVVRIIANGSGLFHANPFLLSVTLAFHLPLVVLCINCKFYEIVATASCQHFRQVRLYSLSTVHVTVEV